MSATEQHGGYVTHALVPPRGVLELAHPRIVLGSEDPRRPWPGRHRVAHHPQLGVLQCGLRVHTVMSPSPIVPAKARCGFQLRSMRSASAGRSARRTRGNVVTTTTFPFGAPTSESNPDNVRAYL